jgi:hypothetical protein
MPSVKICKQVCETVDIPAGYEVVSETPRTPKKGELFLNHPFYNYLGAATRVNGTVYRATVDFIVNDRELYVILREAFKLPAEFEYVSEAPRKPKRGELYVQADATCGDIDARGLPMPRGVFRAPWDYISQSFPIVRRIVDTPCPVGYEVAEPVKRKPRVGDHYLSKYGTANHCSTPDEVCGENPARVILRKKAPPFVWPTWLTAAWIAQDVDCNWFGYSSEPSNRNGAWDNGEPATFLGLTTFTPPACDDWRNSKLRNPNW